MRRHKEVRHLPRAVGEEVKETAMVRDTGGKEKKKSECLMFRLQASEGGRCGVGNRLLLKKHTWVMKEKEGESEGDSDKCR